MENANTPLTYENKWDREDKPIPPALVKSYGVMVFCAALLALVWGSASRAQTQPPACPPVEVAGRTFGLLDVAPVTGCPFSAIIEFTRNQTLADGTHVQTKGKTLVYRDSLGRVRFDSYASTEETPGMVQIFDPVEGVRYFIQPQFAIASRNKWTGPPPNLRGAAQAQQSSAQAPASPPAPKLSIERLKPQQMEGLLATGERITTTIAVGAEGNDRALTIVRETWSSQDMGITLLEKLSDPRSGDTEKRMTNLVPADPDVTLFQVPADYTIKDQQ